MSGGDQVKEPSRKGHGKGYIREYRSTEEYIEDYLKVCYPGMDENDVRNFLEKFKLRAEELPDNIPPEIRSYIEWGYNVLPGKLKEKEISEYYKRYYDPIDIQEDCSYIAICGGESDLLIIEINAKEELTSFEEMLEWYKENIGLPTDTHIVRTTWGYQFHYRYPAYDFHPDVGAEEGGSRYIITRKVIKTGGVKIVVCANNCYVYIPPTEGYEIVRDDYPKPLSLEDFINFGERFKVLREDPSERLFRIILDYIGEYYSQGDKTARHWIACGIANLLRLERYSQKVAKKIVKRLAEHFDDEFIEDRLLVVDVEYEATSPVEYYKGFLRDGGIPEDVVNKLVETIRGLDKKGYFREYPISSWKRIMSKEVLERKYIQRVNNKIRLVTYHMPLDEGKRKIKDIKDLFSFDIVIHRILTVPFMKTTLYDVEIDGHRDIMEFDQAVKYIKERGTYALTLTEISKYFSTLITAYREAGEVEEVVVQYTAPGIYVTPTGELKLALSIEDGVFPTSDKAKEYMELLKEKPIPSEVDMKEIIRFLLELLTHITDRREQINTILLLGWGMIAPFGYSVFRKNEEIAHHFLLYGLPGTGKSFKAHIIAGGYGGYTVPGGDTLESNFRLGNYSIITTFPIFINDITELPDRVQKAIKEGAEREYIMERGTRDQRTIRYPSYASFLITCNNIDWLQDRATRDRFIISLREIKIKTSEDWFTINWKGEEYNPSQISGLLSKNMPPWALRILKDYIHELNEGINGIKGVNALRQILSKVQSRIRDYIVNKLGIKDFPTRDIVVLSRIYVGLTMFITKVKQYCPEWEEFKEPLKWLFDMENGDKFTEVMLKEWLERIYNVNIFLQYVDEIMTALSLRNKLLKTSLESKDATLQSKTKYTFEDDIVISEEDEGVVFITPNFLQRAKKNLRLKEGYTSLKEFAEDYAKATKQPLDKIYFKSTKKFMNGYRPYVVKIELEKLQKFLGEIEGGGGGDS